MAGLVHHEQAESSKGFLVDRSMLTELEALWAQGFSTLFSCGGDRDGAITPGFYGKPMPGYIAFVDVTPEQELRLDRAVRSIGGELEYRVSGNTGIHAVVTRFTGAEAKLFLERLIG